LDKLHFPRPLSLAQIIEMTFRVYWQSPLKFLSFMILPYVYFLLVSHFYLSPLMGKFDYPLSLQALAQNPSPFDINPGIVFTSIILMSFGWLLELVCWMALVRAVSVTLMGGNTTVSEAFQEVIREKFGAMIPTAIMAGLIVLLGFVLLVVPGIFLAIRYCLIIQIVVIEGRRGRAALFRSKELIRGVWWKAFYLVLFFTIIGWLISYLTNSWGDILFAPVGGISLTLFYYDCRAREKDSQVEII